MNSPQTFMYPTPAFMMPVEAQLRGYVLRLYSRARIVLGDQCNASPSGLVQFYLRDLREEGDAHPIATSLEIVSHLIDGSEIEKDSFWNTSLGRSLAWHIGYHLPEVPAPTAAAILRCSRQAVAKRADRLNVPVLTSVQVMKALRESWVRHSWRFIGT